MASAAPAVEDLLAPVSEDRPAGEDIFETPDWPAIKEARKRDKIYDRANWDWPLIEELLRSALRKSKDLKLGVWLLEAEVELHGFAGLRDGCRLIRGLLEKFWDSGLYPEAVLGDLENRARALEWLSGADNLPFSIRHAPLIARADGGTDYSYNAYRQAKEIGWEKDTRNQYQDIDEKKAAKRQKALEDGGVSMEMFEEAVQASSRAGLEARRAEWLEASKEFEELDRVLGEKFGDQAPATTDSKEALEDCRRVLDDVLKRKEPAPPPLKPNDGKDTPPPEPNRKTPVPMVPDFGSMDAGDGGSWDEAERLVSEGDVDRGLAKMAALATQQYGRANFQRRLRLAEICLETNRNKLGIAILEELAKIVDEHHLENWESSSLLGRVWGRLYRCYKSSDGGSEQSARGAALFDRLCRLDPWQALRWDE
jgi:type VI secretion system ImpA family protein